MKAEVAYTYLPLRYVHDVATGEFVNIGVALYAPSMKLLAARCLTRSIRLRQLYGNFNEDHIASILSHVQAQIEITNSCLQSDPKLAKAKTVEELVTRVLPRDDSSLQWGSSGSGVTSDPRAALTKLFDRLVAKYEDPQRHGATFDFEHVLNARLAPIVAATKETKAALYAMQAQYSTILAVLNVINSHLTALHARAEQESVGAPGDIRVQFSRQTRLQGSGDIFTTAGNRLASLTGPLADIRSGANIDLAGYVTNLYGDRDG